MRTIEAPVAVVLDTNILVSALRSTSGASRRVLDLALAGTLALHVTVPLALETYGSYGSTYGPIP